MGAVGDALPVTYTERNIGRALARNVFKGMLCVVDRCTWPGNECDLLVVTNNLRVIDVEIKISRADLRADRAKDKWFGHQGWAAYKRGEPRPPLQWPRNTWKHYYVVAAPVWKDDLLEHCGTASGVLTVDLEAHPSRCVQVVRRATPNRKNTPLSAADAIDIARLASLRMWDAYKELEDYRVNEKSVDSAARVPQP